MEIGEPIREVTIEPLEEPVPKEEPVEPERVEEPEKVPA